MLIPVMYPSGKHDLVKDYLLSQLINDKGIVKFKRSSGWISVTATDIRRGQRVSYGGPERRQQDEAMADLIDIF